LLTKEKHFCCSNLTAVGLKNRRKVNWVTEDPMGRHIQDSSTRTVVKNQWPKTSGNGVHLHNIHNSGISRHRSPGDKMLELFVVLTEGHTLMGIIGLIYLFNPYAYKIECTVNFTYFMQIIEYHLKFKQQSDYVNLINILSHIIKDTCPVKILWNALCLITFCYFMCYS